MKRIFCIFLLLLFVCIDVFAQVKLSLSSVGNYSLVERTNLRRYENGKYIGLSNREVRSFISTSQDGVSDGNFYVVEKTIRDRTDGVFAGIYDSIPSKFSIGKDGKMQMKEDNGYPTFRSFPSFPNRAVKPGDTWIATAERAVDPLNKGVFTKLKIEVKYNFIGEEVYKGRAVYRIGAAWQTLYGMSWKDPLGDPDLKKARGGHKAEILVLKSNGTPILVNDTVDESFTFADGTTSALKGRISLFVEFPPNIDKDEILPALGEIASVDDSLADELKPTSPIDGDGVEVASLGNVPKDSAFENETDERRENKSPLEDLKKPDFDISPKNPNENDGDALAENGENEDEEYSKGGISSSSSGKSDGNGSDGNGQNRGNGNSGDNGGDSENGIASNGSGGNSNGGNGNGSDGNGQKRGNGNSGNDDRDSENGIASSGSGGNSNGGNGNGSNGNGQNRGNGNSGNGGGNSENGIAANGSGGNTNGGNGNGSDGNGQKRGNGNSGNGGDSENGIASNSSGGNSNGGNGSNGNGQNRGNGNSGNGGDSENGIASNGSGKNANGGNGGNGNGQNRGNGNSGNDRDSENGIASNGSGGNSNGEDEEYSRGGITSSSSNRKSNRSGSNGNGQNRGNGNSGNGGDSENGIASNSSGGNSNGGNGSNGNGQNRGNGNSGNDGGDSENGIASNSLGGNSNGGNGGNGNGQNRGNGNSGNGGDSENGIASNGSGGNSNGGNSDSEEEKSKKREELFAMLDEIGKKDSSSKKSNDMQSNESNAESKKEPKNSSGTKKDSSSKKSGEKKSSKKSEEPPKNNMLVEKTNAGIRLSVRNIQFMADSSNIVGGESKRLDEIAKVLALVKDGKFLIEGHTARVGDIRSEQELSEKRAKVIAQELIKRGVNADSFICRGWGGEKPIATNKNEKGKAQNRRVEITILE